MANANKTSSATEAALIEAALDYAARGLPIIPLRGKIPALHGWQQFVSTLENCDEWFGSRSCNIGLRTGESGYIVVDTDTPQAEEWARTHLPATPMTALSGGGSMHRYYRAPVRSDIRNVQGLKGIPGLDIRGHGGFIVLPPSIHPETGKCYEWLGEMLPPAKLPLFSTAWVSRKVPPPARMPIIEVDDDKLLCRVSAYVAKIEPAISGQGGHNKTYYAACKIVDLVDGDPSLAWHFLQLYNARCLPRWSERELRHKWQDALKSRG